MNRISIVEKSAGMVLHLEKIATRLAIIPVIDDIAIKPTLLAECDSEAHVPVSRDEFAVVADEVNLPKEHQGNKRNCGMIKTIRVKTSQTVKSMEGNSRS